MNTRKLLQERIKTKLKKKILASFDFISSYYKECSTEFLSIDNVQLKSFEEIRDLGSLYLCNNSYPFLCITQLPLSNKKVQELRNDISFKSPLTIFVVSISVIDYLENDNLLLLIFPKNSKRKSFSTLLALQQLKVRSN